MLRSKGLMIALLLLIAWPSWAETQSTWRAVLFDGRKVGYAVTEREVLGNGVIRSAEIMSLEIQRDGASVSMSSLEETLESKTGEPVGFRAEIKTAGQTLRYRGSRQSDGKFKVVIDGAGSTREQTIEIPPFAKFFEAQRIALSKAIASGKSLLAIDAFIPSQLETVSLETSFKGRRRVELMQSEAELMEIEQIVRYPNGPMQVHAFVDDVFDAQRIRMDLMGMKIELLACDQACAKAPNQTLDFLDKLVIAAPRALTRRDLQKPLRYVLKIEGTEIQPAQSNHQRVWRDGEQLWAAVAPSASGTGEVDLIYTLPSAWVQSDSVIIQDLAKRAAGKATKPAQQMANAEAFVRQYIFGKTLSVGYASALEVATSRQGDCTEHALLLTAIARALGIPARVATGLAYVPSFGERDHVFVPHAWMEAHIDGRWTGFDAALNGFDSGHLALAFGDGDPVRYFAGVALLGRLQIERVESP